MGMRALSSRWNNLWAHLANSNPEQEFQQLAAAYQEPQRAYHNLEHVETCLKWFDRSCHLTEDPLAIELALWFHDVIYDPHASDNETQSASWALRVMREGEVSESLQEKVVKLILATSPELSPKGLDSQQMVDIDLATLGAKRSKYVEYQHAIRQEFKGLPEDLYRDRRVEFLQSFLARPSIFYTKWFRDRLEGQARANIKWEIQERLKGLK